MKTFNRATHNRRKRYSPPLIIAPIAEVVKRIILVFLFLFLAQPAVMFGMVLYQDSESVAVEDIFKDRRQRSVGLTLETNYIDKVFRVLNAQKDFGNPRAAHHTLNEILNRIESKINPKSKYNKKSAIKALKKIGTLLKREGHFVCRENNLLIQGLEKEAAGKRYIDCDDYASIYLLAAESIGLSLRPVYAAGHMFLMCSLEDNTSFYWEPTVTAEKDWVYYKDWLNIADDSIYPKVLSDKEFEAIHACNLGVAWHEKGEYAAAIIHYQEAIRLHPEFAEAYNNLGVAYAKQGKYDKALECYQKAVHLNENYGDCYLNTGIAFHKLGLFQEAIKHYEKAIVVEPQNKKALRYEYIAWVKQKEPERAIEFVKKIHTVKIPRQKPPR